MKTKIACLLLLITSSLMQEAWCQACCSGGVPVGGTLGLGTADPKAVQFLFTYDHNVLRDLMDGNALLSDDTRSRLTRSFLMEVNYGIHGRFALTLVLPFVRQERSIREYNNQIGFTRAQGLGDMVFLLKYRMLNPLKHPNREWLIGAGPKIPTGRTDFKNNQGLTMVADMQPGSGSLDGMFWSFYQQSKFLTPSMSLLGILTYRASGKNRNYNQTQVYQFGNEFQANLGVNYNLFVHWPMDVFVFGRYRSQTVDLVDGNTFPGSGGKWVYLIPGLGVHFNPDLSLRAWADFPLYRSLNGSQLTTSYKYSLSLFFNISKKSKAPVFNLKLDE
ncbi:transporter [Cyclobacterium sp.]|uniref:transporter n=1 Tax=Cyclobacterium sp. TaxID=1966343 RepID=UPI0019A973FE|nr:transporter [Cyclobacterium sp.]MBD3630612.1 transporter [Cyclobacterium sp.]